MSIARKLNLWEELNAYSPLVAKGSYIVATDESMKYLHDVPRGDSEWIWDNPTEAALKFAGDNPEFVVEQPEWEFNESELTENITHWPGAYLRRV